MLIYGKQTVLYVAEHHPEMMHTLYIAKELDKKLYNQLMRSNFELKRTKPEHIQSLCKSGNHQGFAAEVSDFTFEALASVQPMQKILVLAGLTDMGNIGAIIRSAYALGIEAVIIAGVKQIQIEALARTSSGALFDLPIIHEPQIMDLPNYLKQSGFTTYGAAMAGEDVQSIKVAEKSALFMGNEGEGLSNRLEKSLDKKISIKMTHDFDSLNVSVATAILIDRMR